MGKKAPKAPKAPDPVATANAQAEANQDTARLEANLNRVNQVTPWGNVTYNDLGNDRWSQTVSLSPQEQQTYNLTKGLENRGLQLGQGVLGQVESAWGNPLDFSGLTPMNTDFGAQRDRMTQASYDRFKGFLDPRFTQEQDNLDSKLAAQGITLGSDAYTRAQGDFSRNKDAAYQQALDSAVQMGASEANTLFGQNMQARNQGLSELLTQRQQPMNELAALMNISSVGAPSYGQAQPVGVAPTDVLGATQMGYQGQLNAYNQQLQQQQATMGGLFGLGGALGSALILSDARFKERLTRIGQTSRGLPLYEFSYKGRPGRYRGVLAQEAFAVHPEAVKQIGGVLHVDYSQIEA